MNPVASKINVSDDPFSIETVPQKIKHPPILDKLLSKEETEANSRKAILPLDAIPKLLPPAALSSYPSTLSIDAVEELTGKLANDRDWADSALDAEVLQQLHVLRSSREEFNAITAKHIQMQQQHCKTLHQELNTKLQELEERAKTSEALQWVEVGTTSLLVALSVISFVASIVTGGLSAILGVITTIAATANGVVGATNGIRQLQDQEKRGLTQKDKEIRAFEHDKIHALVTDIHRGNGRVGFLWGLGRDIIQNRNNLQILN